MLLISGKLDLTPGDSPVKGLGTLVKSNNADAEDYIREESSRRSLYLPIIRNELPPVLTVFDFADPDLVVGKRSETNVPSQALFLMNSPFVMDCAEQTAIAICKNNQDTISQVVNATYKKVLARQPDQDEIIQAAKFLGYTGGTADPDQNQNATSEPLATRLARFIHMMFASTEFRMID